MQILCFSDLYQIEKVPTIDCDLVVLLGNVSKKVIREIEIIYQEQPIVGLLSNTCAPDTYAGTQVIDIHEKVVEIDGIRFSGYGGVPSHGDSRKGYYTEKQCKDFIDKLAVSDVDVLLSYSNPAYGDLKGNDSKDGFKAYNEIFINKLTKYLIHGRLHQNLKRTLAKVNIHIVYEHQLITIKELKGGN
ncbi:MAG: hypothetical protein KBT36_13895 [Kurthia sp.]|nr:hypothetical protein [Candidatus Kurthia equi]